MKKSFPSFPSVRALFCTGLVGFALTAASVQAASFSFTSGGLGASANFVPGAGNTLTVTLTNTGTGDVLVPTDVLTAVFFNVSPTAAGTSSVSAILTGGSSVSYDADGQPAGGVVGGEWAFGTGLSGAPLGANSGISSSGLGLFGGATFPGPDLEGPAAVNGLQYGLLSAGDNAATGNGGITGSGGLIKNSVLFTLGNWNPNWTINNVTFQYGTSLTEPSFPSGPGPSVPDGGSTLILAGIALAALGILSRRLGRSKQ